jgi:hypothetical protein
MVASTKLSGAIKFLVKGGKMINKTPEERKAISAKAHATRKANKAKIDAAREEALIYANGLKATIANLEFRLTALHHEEQMNVISCQLTDKALLSQEQIVKASIPWERSTGVYFLVWNDEVVYVGQSVNVYSRITHHSAKEFDRYAYIPCHEDALDRLESLYIHCFRPRLNGNANSTEKSAPIRLDKLLGIKLKEKA